MAGRVSFLGAGPGAADLITVRGARRLAEADIVVWASIAVDPACIREHARQDAEVVDSSRIDSDRLWEIYRRAAGDRLRVVRVCAGDSAVWGSIQEEHDGCRRLGLDVEILPGVTEFATAAAIIGRELTTPAMGRTLLLSGWDGGATQVADGERIRDFARYGTTMVVSMPAARVRQLVEQLRSGGCPEETPVVLAYKVTCPGELVLRTTVGELADTVRQHRLWRQTLFLVGDALRPAEYNGSAAAYAPTHREEPGGPPADGVRLLTTPHPRSGAEWAMRVRRSSWTAARADATHPADAADQPSDVPGPASVAAWSAVRQWQETARSAGRATGRNRTVADHARPASPPAHDQPALALEPADGTPSVTDRVTAVSSPRPEQAPPTAKPVARKPPARRGKRTSKPNQAESPAVARRDTGGATAAPAE